MSLLADFRQSSQTSYDRMKRMFVIIFVSCHSHSESSSWWCWPISVSFNLLQDLTEHSHSYWSLSDTVVHEFLNLHKRMLDESSDSFSVSIDIRLSLQIFCVFMILRDHTLHRRMTEWWLWLSLSSIFDINFNNLTQVLRSELFLFHFSISVFWFKHVANNLLELLLNVLDRECIE